MIADSENKENETFVKRHEEYQYLDLVREVVRLGKTKMDRTNVGTISMFGTQSRYSLRNGICSFFPNIQFLPYKQ